MTEPARINPHKYRHGKWLITYDPKPIPDRRFDWNCEHDHYDGETCSDMYFCAESIKAAIEEIKRITGEQND